MGGAQPSGSGIAIAVAISLLLVALAGPCLVTALWVDYAADYHGTCGPHPTDIPEHPCPFDQYAVEFFSPFATIALAMFACGAWIGAALLVGAAWVIWALVRVAVRGAPVHPADRGRS